LESKLGNLMKDGKHIMVFDLGNNTESKSPKLGFPRFHAYFEKRLIFYLRYEKKLYCAVFD